MPYDSDKTRAVIAALKDAMDAGKVKNAMSLLRHADNGGGLRQDAGLLASLSQAVGSEHAGALVRAFASDACPYCTNGREKCPDCQGKGSYVATKVCKPCAGLGLLRCPFCNGTSFAGYGFVPRGLQPAVMKVRMAFADNRIGELADEHAKTESESTRELAKRLIDIDRCRGVLANAVEQARIQEVGAPGSRGVFTASERHAIERDARRLNGLAERTLRAVLKSMGERFAAKAAAAADGDQRTLTGHRAKVFLKLAAGDGLAESSLRTPRALRRDP